jgi:putative heme iron utilization protein
MDVLRGLKDFHLFRLALQSGNYVAGFGKAYELCGDGLDELRHISSG